MINTQVLSAAVSFPQPLRPEIICFCCNNQPASIAKQPRQCAKCCSYLQKSCICLKFIPIKQSFTHTAQMVKRLPCFHISKHLVIIFGFILFYQAGNCLIRLIRLYILPACSSIPFRHQSLLIFVRSNSSKTSCMLFRSPYCPFRKSSILKQERALYT